MLVRYGGTKLDCPSCGAEGEFHKLRDRRVYACPNCLFQIAPTANTILHDTRTPLVSWFYAMYLFCTTRHGVSGKELQRQLGVTYKTAWRMGWQIRKLTEKADHFDALLCGHVEIDEAYVGGRVSGFGGGRGAPNKTIVLGMIERKGRTVARIIPDVKTTTTRPNHGKGEYSRFVIKSLSFHVNSVEGFWRLLKASVRSTHVLISPKYMQRYLSEFTFRADHRGRVNGMFDLLVGAL